MMDSISPLQVMLLQVLQTLLDRLPDAKNAGAAAAGGPTGAPGEFEALIQAAAARNGVDPQLVTAVIQAESNFNPSAVSRAGAQGLMQLMPGTAAGLGVTDAFDPEQNVDAGARLLRRLLDRYHSVPLALAAYNAGPGAVDRYGGVPPYRETQTYVNRIMNNLNTSSLPGWSA